MIDGLAYPILIADDAAAEIMTVWPEARRAAVVFDRNVATRALPLESALRAAGVDVLGVLGIAAGERRKRMRSVEAIHAWLLERGADRRTVIVAVGGGTLTDVAGFAAATFLRGAPWVAVPTTVLGMVDAAIGGKTGVDRPEGKNLIGAFWDPAAVVADLGALDSLALSQRRTGMAEIIKSAIIANASLLDEAAAMRLHAPAARWRPLIAAAARVKVDVVAADPREVGPRAVLNLGHTVGHALELASGYRLKHGEAVSIGLRAAGLLSLHRAFWGAQDHGRVLGTLRACGLPLWSKGLAVDVVAAAMTKDKKRRDGKHRFVLPTAIGAVRVGVEVTNDEVRSTLLACAAPPQPFECPT